MKKRRTLLLVVLLAVVAALYMDTVLSKEKAIPSYETWSYCFPSWVMVKTCFDNDLPHNKIVEFRNLKNEKVLLMWTAVDRSKLIFSAREFDSKRFYRIEKSTFRFYERRLGHWILIEERVFVRNELLNKEFQVFEWSSPFGRALLTYLKRRGIDERRIVMPRVRFETDAIASLELMNDAVPQLRPLFLKKIANYGQLTSEMDEMSSRVSQNM